MLTYQGWLSTNIQERLRDPLVSFDVGMHLYHFKSMEFQSACDLTAQQISEQHNKLFLGFSGGVDSEFVLKVFLRNKLPITPIIVEFEGNEQERMYAHEFCQQHDIKPIVLSLNNKQLMELIYHEIIKKYNGRGMYAVGSIAACQHATQHNGVLLLGEHAVGDGKDKIDNFQYYFSEWDDYVENIPFYVYSLEIFYAMMQTIDIKYDNWMTYKSQIFGCSLRNKMKPKFHYSVDDLIGKLLVGRPNPTNDKFYIGTREDVNKLVECWKLS